MNTDKIEQYCHFLDNLEFNNGGVLVVDTLMYGLRIIEKSQETLHNPLQIMISIVNGFETILTSELSTIKEKEIVLAIYNVM